MQLDFDLQRGPEPPEGPKVHTVAELTRRVRDLLEGGIGEVWVEGEISNLRRQASGHRYFTLKDEAAQMACVLFGRTAPNVTIADGQSVQLFGELSVYEPRGQYQMIVRLVRDRGEGVLQAKFEALKRRLAAEGLFDAARKRALPRFPASLGVVTSPTGAAIRDFLQVLHRRHPGIRVIINPVRVQGRGAAAEIARAVAEFGEPARHGLPAVDVIVLTRGGGSIEDLWEFNEEVVARAIAASPVPVLSAVGHEIDFTIADFVADLRAPTPSAAAEILAAERTEILGRLRREHARMDRCWEARRDRLDARLAALRQSELFREPARRLSELAQTLDRQSAALSRAARLAVEKLRSRTVLLGARLAAGTPAIRDFHHRARLAIHRAGEAAAREVAARRGRLDRLAGMLAALDPLATLARGYTITSDADGRPLGSRTAVKTGMTLRTRFSDGEAESIAR